MGRFYFDVTNGHGFERDQVGVELGSLDEVCREASRIMADLAREEMPINASIHIEVDVRDGLGKNVYSGELNFRGNLT